ncbi:hypothetical protein [Sulfuricurvum sp.]|uniref:hypothetical protein n=1 Tax=Sulfuricurvum sp. TaxID=2025608 RepID=UPI002618CF00|nr:hypothetical protein [Sulfuricurvum sp.]MDD2780359.1 hypothetical protein [Sulfuricurvum sp.]
MDNKNQIRSSLISDSARDSAREYQHHNLQARRQMENDFFQKSLDYRDFVFSPEGYEGLVLALYIATIPYLMGLLFLFLFVAEASYEYFLQFNLASFFVIWAIGYEVCAALILIGIFLSWLNHINGRWKKEQARKKPQKSKYSY